MRRSSIPPVKTWKATMVDGRVYHVETCSRFLVKLILHDPLRPDCWGPIKSIGVLRKRIPWTGTLGKPLVTLVKGPDDAS